MEDKDFLQEYEIKHWDLNSRMVKIIAFSTFFTFFGVFAIAQSNLLRSKACDTYYMGKVCQALDSVYVMSAVYSGDEGYVVKDYERTKIDDADVVWVDQTGVEPKFTYPEGYFYKESEEIAALPGENPFGFDPIAPPSDSSQMIAPPSSSDSGGSGGIWSVKPKIPKQNNKPVSGDLPDSILGTIGDDPSSDSNDSKKADDTKKKNSLEEKTANKSEPVKDVDINKKPLYDFADEALEKYGNKTVDFSEQFRVKLTGEIDKNGRLVRNKTRYIEAIGDPDMVEVAKRGIESVGESGWLHYLSDLEVKNLDMVFAQNDTNLMAQVNGKLPTKEKADTVASGLNVLISTTLLSHNNNLKRLKDDEFVLLKSAKVQSNGNVVTINFILEKPTALGIIKSRLAEYKAIKAKGEIKPSGSTPNNGANEDSAR